MATKMLIKTWRKGLTNLLDGRVDMKKTIKVSQVKACEKGDLLVERKEVWKNIFGQGKKLDNFGKESSYTIQVCC